MTGQGEREGASKLESSSHPDHPPSLRQLLIAIVAVLFSMASVTAGAAFAKSLFLSIGAEGTTALRNGYGAIMLLAVFRPWRGEKLTAEQWRLLLLYGCSMGAMNLMFYTSLKTLPLGLAVAIEFTGPFTLALVTSRRTTDFLWLVLAMAGMAMLLPWGEGPVAADPRGVVFALGAGILWALYIVFGQRAGRSMPGGRVASLGIAIGSMITIPIGLHHAGLAMFAGSSLLIALAVGFFSSAIPYSMDMVAMKRLPTRTFGILMSLEPAVAALSGLILLGEELTLRQMAAIALVILASLGSTSSVRKVAVPQEGL